MKTKTQMKVVLTAVTALFILPSWADDPAPEGTVVSGEITPKLYYFDYFKGFGADKTQFLERYNYQEGLDNDSRTDIYLDADLNLSIASPEREIFRLERVGFGEFNHRGNIKADTDKLEFTGYYSHFRSANGGLAFLYSPNQVPGGTDPTYNVPANATTGYVAQFNDDSGQTLFKIDRTTYGAGFALKPELFGPAASAAPSVALNYDGYAREGNRFATYLLGNGDVNGPGNTANRALARWRGFDMPVDENMNRFTLNLNGAPGGFHVAYEGSLEKFDNQARNYGIADFVTNIQATPGAVVTAAGLTKPIHFIPDSTLISNNLRLTKNFGSTAIALGAGLSILDQDSFTQQEQTLGYNTGKITTSSAYLNVNSNALGAVGVEGFLKYSNRDNDSSFPVVGLINPAAGEQLGVRINGIESLSYGLAATFRTAMLKSTITPGWKREDKERDLTWTAVSTVVPTLNGIQPQRSLYREETLSDEVYVKLVSRPMPGVIFRLTPSYIWADQTGLVTEPDKALHVKTKLSYAAASGMLVSGYYNYKKKENDTGTLTDALLPAGTDGAVTTQDVNKVQQAAGVSLNIPVSQWINTTASLSWMQDDFATYYLRSDRRRFEAPNNAVDFITQDQSNYLIDTYVFTLGGDWQATDALRWDGSYTFSKSAGDTASGTILNELTAVAGSVDGQINNAIHTVALGANYAFTKRVKFRGSYSYDYYTDEVYAALSGGVHTVMLAVAVGF